MKQIPVLIMLGLALSLCNLTDKLKSSKNSNAGSKSSSSGKGSVVVEKAQPTAAQTTALAGGEAIKWEQQGIEWTVPPKWTKLSDDKNSFSMHSAGGSDAANLIASISAMSEDFPTEISLNAFYDGAKTRMKNGEVDKLRWLEIDGVKGIEFRESNPEKPDGIRRLQWLTYRKYAGQVQMVNLILSSSGKGFPGHEDEMTAVLYSTKLVH